MADTDNSQLVQQFQMYQQQYQTILVQKEQMRLQELEIDKALEELKSTKDGKAYKITGPIMVKKDAEDLKKELEEKKEDMDVRVKTLNKAEERIKSKLKEMEEDVKKMVK